MFANCITGLNFDGSLVGFIAEPGLSCRLQLHPFKRIRYSKHGIRYRARPDGTKETSKLVGRHMHLSQLELISITYICLRGWRICGSHRTGKQENASREYACILMGLLRCWQESYTTDSKLKAFAGFSDCRSNKNGPIFGRSLCMQPPERGPSGMR